MRSSFDKFSKLYIYYLYIGKVTGQNKSFLDWMVPMKSSAVRNPIYYGIIIELTDQLQLHSLLQLMFLFLYS